MNKLLVLCSCFVCAFLEAALPLSSGGQLYNWGLGFSGKAAAIASLTNCVQISANVYWALGLKEDGSLVAWGNTGTPGQVEVPEGPFVYASAGWEHGLAITTNGSIIDWGIPSWEAKTNWTAAPTNGVFTEVSGGTHHSAALRDDGVVITWGSTSWANGTNITHAVSNAVHITSGWYAVGVINSNSTVSTFGLHLQGGSGGYITPPAGLSNVVRLEGNRYTFTATKSDGTVVTWGYPDPVGYTNTPSSVRNIYHAACGETHTLAVDAEGYVKTWGTNRSGVLDIPPRLGSAAIIDAMYFSSYAIQGTPASGGSEPLPSARVYYVRKDGNDDHDGRENTPDGAMLTIGQALQDATAGSYIYVGPGTYDETAETVNPGSALSPITVDGQGWATVRAVSMQQPYINLINFTVTGVTAPGGNLVYMMRGAHNCVVSNNVIDGANAPYVIGVGWQSSATRPFGTDAASRCLIIDNLITRVEAAAGVAMQGDNNIFKQNRVINLTQADFIRLWGRSNLITQNTFTNNISAANLGYHPDFIQIFGNNGVGSQDHIIERNLVQWIHGGQLGQFEGNLVPEIGRITFRNNIFANLALQASGSIPDVYFYNNTFYNCSTNSNGHMITYGARYYGYSSVASSSPYYPLLTNVIPSGSIQYTTNYMVYAGTNATDYIIYNGTTNASGDRFVGVSGITTYTTSGDALVHTALANYAHNNRVLNNVFIRDSDDKSNTGWYSFGQTTTNLWCDYNYVAVGSGFQPIDMDGTYRTNGAPGGWSPFDWYEPHGINGGDPGIPDLTNHIFSLSKTSKLIDAGLSIPGVTEDFFGNVRSGGIDIGAFEYAGDPVVHITFEDDFTDGQIDDISGNGAHALRYGWGSTGTNWPTASSPGAPLNMQAAHFEPYYWTRPWDLFPDYYDGQYAAITNVPPTLIGAKNFSVALWARYSDSPAEYSPTDSQGTFINVGWDARGCWHFGRYYSSTYGEPKFLVVTNAGDLSDSARISFPTIGQFTNDVWRHYAVTVSCDVSTNLVITLYTNGFLYSVTQLPLAAENAIDGLTVADPGGAHGPWIGLSCWTHNHTPELELDKNLNNGWLNGEMDDLRIYDRILSAREIESIAEGALTEPTFYVSTSGNDTNSGGVYSPWRTIQHGVDTISAGDTLSIASGDYPEYVDTAKSGSSQLPITITGSGIGATTLRGFDFLDGHEHVIIDKLVFWKTQRSLGQAIRVSEGAHNSTIQNCEFWPTPHMNRTNFVFEGTDNTITSPSGSDWTEAGFEVGGAVRFGASSIEPYMFSNADTNRTIVSIDGDVMTVDVLVAETNSSAWSIIYASGPTATGMRGITMLGDGAANLVIRDNVFDGLYGIAIDARGAGPVEISGNTFDCTAWAAIRFGADNMSVTGNLFLNNEKFLFYSRREGEDVPHPAGAGSYDFQQGYMRSDVILGNNVTFSRNWVENIHNPLGQMPTVYASGWVISSNVFIGAQSQWDGLARSQPSIFNNTFYRVSFDSSGTGHALNMASGATNVAVIKNVFVNNGDHSSTNSEGFYYTIAEQLNSTYASNFVSSTETMNWIGASTFAETNGVNGGDPLFVDIQNPRGADGLPFTDDDGLRPLQSSQLALKGLGALSPVTLTEDTPIAHFTLRNVVAGWKDLTGTNFNTSWEAVPPFARTNFVRPWDTYECLGRIPCSVTLDASGSISGTLSTNGWTGITNCIVDWDDGSSSTSATNIITHTYAVAGVYNVSVTVQNDANNTDVSTRYFRVLNLDGSEPDPDPDPEPSGSARSIRVGNLRATNVRRQ